jgi:hypothetical protein
MYGLVEYEVSRQRRADIRREVAAYRLDNELRAGRGKEARSLEDLGRKLAQYAGLLGKRPRGQDGADCYRAAKNGGGPMG